MISIGVAFAIVGLQLPPPLGTAQEGSGVASVAVLPVSFQDGTETAIKTANETLAKLLEAGFLKQHDRLEVTAAWEVKLKNKPVTERVKARDYFPSLPEESKLLSLGQTLAVDFVVALRCSFSTTSKWVALGPKTKAFCTAQVIVIDVKAKEVAHEATSTMDSTRRESNLETAASLLVSVGFTAFSGGPKTPHQQAAAQLALAEAVGPWILRRKDQVTQRRKISDSR